MLYYKWYIDTNMNGSGVLPILLSAADNASIILRLYTHHYTGEE